MDLETNFAKNLKALRTKRQLSTRGLGEKAGISGVYVYQIEARLRTPTMGVVCRLAEALGVQPLALLKDPPR